jgi:hypothetical protein
MRRRLLSSIWRPYMTVAHHVRAWRSESSSDGQSRVLENRWWPRGDSVGRQRRTLGGHTGGPSPSEARSQRSHRSCTGCTAGPPSAGGSERRLTVGLARLDGEVDLPGPSAVLFARRGLF